MLYCMCLFDPTYYSCLIFSTSINSPGSVLSQIAAKDSHQGDESVRSNKCLGKSENPKTDQHSVQSEVFFPHYSSIVGCVFIMCVLRFPVYHTEPFGQNYLHIGLAALYSIDTQLKAFLS